MGINSDMLQLGSELWTFLQNSRTSCLWPDIYDFSYRLYSSLPTAS